MPSIKSRLARDFKLNASPYADDTMSPPTRMSFGGRGANVVAASTQPAMVANTSGNQFSLPGNPAPTRGNIPVEYTYQFDVNRYLPDNHMLRSRSWFVVNQFDRTLGYIALAKATGK